MIPATFRFFIWFNWFNPFTPTGLWVALLLMHAGLTRGQMGSYRRWPQWLKPLFFCCLNHTQDCGNCCALTLTTCYATPLPLTRVVLFMKSKIQPMPLINQPDIAFQAKCTYWCSWVVYKRKSWQTGLTGGTNLSNAYYGSLSPQLVCLTHTHSHCRWSMQPQGFQLTFPFMQMPQMCINKHAPPVLQVTVIK